MGAVISRRPELDDPSVDFGVATRALDGESGDLHLVQSFAGGVLIAVADGLGHGPGAAAAAKAATAILAAHPGESVPWLMKACHDALKGTRGAVLSLASIDASAGRMSWAGIGNVEVMLFHPTATALRHRDAVMLQGGILGHRYPAPRVATLPIEPGDLLAFATDGIRADFEKEIHFANPLQVSADRVLARCGKATDDALILIARWNGRPAAGKA
jgi:negative regulator of sigma-B (phosphoserine phosphatase)